MEGTLIHVDGTEMLEPLKCLETSLTRTAKMITIAVPGGTAPGLGRAVVTAIQQYPDQLKVIVLSRQGSTVPEWLKNSGVEVRKVDYSSQDSLYDALQGVHTVSCCLDPRKSFVDGH